ncbi:hypothetical protein [Nitrosomonas sp. ANs5]|uniref:hypothetical protein n=1 Tax=Nitrosomonas sp. ANs5 TaxID=3423941 RepID=UPI003D341C10
MRQEHDDKTCRMDARSQTPWVYISLTGTRGRIYTDALGTSITAHAFSTAP